MRESDPTYEVNGDELINSVIVVGNFVGVAVKAGKPAKLEFEVPTIDGNDINKLKALEGEKLAIRVKPINGQLPFGR